MHCIGVTDRVQTQHARRGHARAQNRSAALFRPVPGWYVTPRQLKSKAVYDLTSDYCFQGDAFNNNNTNCEDTNSAPVRRTRGRWHGGDARAGMARCWLVAGLAWGPPCCGRSSRAPLGPHMYAAGLLGHSGELDLWREL